MNYRFILLSILALSTLLQGATLNSGAVTLDISGTSPTNFVWGGADHHFSSGLQIVVRNGGSLSFASVPSSVTNENFQEPAAAASEEWTATFNTSVSDGFSGTVTARAFSDQFGVRQNSFILIYTLTNTGTQTYEEVFPSMRYDLDVGSTTSNDFAADESRSLFYQFSGGTSPYIVGMRVLSGPVHSMHFASLGSSTYSSAEAMASGTFTVVSDGSFRDLGCAISQRYTSVAPGQTVTFALGMFFANSLTDLQAVSDATGGVSGGFGGGGIVGGGTGGGQPKTPVYDGASYTLPPSGGGGGCLLK